MRKASVEAALLKKYKQLLPENQFRNLKRALEIAQANPEYWADEPHTPERPEADEDGEVIFKMVRVN